MNRTTLICIVFISNLILGCNRSIETDYVSETNPSQVEDLPQNTPIPEGEDTLLFFDYAGTDFGVQLLYPEGQPKGCMLILQGWNFPRTDWCDSTNLCSMALEEGYVLICPDMGKSIYANKTYPQTRQDWLKYPTRSWLVETVIKNLQDSLGLFMPDGNNFVVGLSTGGRGALLVALDLPNVFSAAACLSGDYDQSKFPSDNLYKGFFGPMNKFPELWEGVENPIRRINELKSAVYISHGDLDEVCSIEHSEILYNAIKSETVVKTVFKIGEGMAHNYAFWNSEVAAILDFFASVSDESKF